MPLIIILLLACVWIYLAYSSFQAGNTVMGVLWLAIGSALTIWRLRRRSG